MLLVLSSPTAGIAERLTGYRSLSDTKWGYSVIKGLARAGTKSQRFELRPGDCGQGKGWNDCETDRERSEYILNKKVHLLPEAWIGFSIFFPQDFRSAKKVQTKVFQLNMRDGPKQTTSGNDFHQLVSLVNIQVENGNLTVCLYRFSKNNQNRWTDQCDKTRLGALSAYKGKWTDVVVRYAGEGRGFFELYFNGHRVAREDDIVRFRPRDVYVKYGLYRPRVSKESGKLPTQIVFFDEIRIGKSLAEVRVDPFNPMD